MRARADDPGNWTLVQEACWRCCIVRFFFPPFSVPLPLPLPLFLSVSLYSPRRISTRPRRLLHFGSHTHTRAALRAAHGKKKVRACAHTYTRVCVCVCNARSFSFSLSLSRRVRHCAHTERGFPACGERSTPVSLESSRRR